MTNHPHRAIKVKTLHDTLICGTREWSWTVEVKVGGRTFHVTRKSRLGAFGDIDSPQREAGACRRLVEMYLDGSLKNQSVIEV